MLIDVIKDYSVVMPELIKYIKNRGYEPKYFFVQMKLSLQYIIIFEFLLSQYNMVMIVTPKVMGVRCYDNSIDDNSDIIFVAKTPDDYKVNREYYETLIDAAFKYLQNTPF